MPRLTISLLGRFQVTLRGEPVTQFGSDTARALLAYLALHRGAPVRRDMLAGLLWPESPDAHARHSLRVAFSRLRTAIRDRETETPLLPADRKTITFVEGASVGVDVEELRRLVAMTRAHAHDRIEGCDACAALLQRATGLYRGEFLAGFSLDSVPFEEWMIVQREGLHWQALEALQTLAAYHEQQGDYTGAIERARQQVELEPWREVAHRQWMRALALSGHRGAALAQYEACRQVLAEELGVDPGSETVQLYEAIRDGTLQPLRRDAGTPIPTPSPEPVELPVAPSLPTTANAGALAVPALKPGDRRLVTALWARVNEPEAVLDQLGPEAWAEVIREIDRIVETNVDRFGGQVFERQQDRLLAVFGVPTIHEDDPERAVLTALAVQQAIDRRQGHKVKACIGVDTAEVLVTYVDGEPRITGRARALAQRAGVAAKPGTVHVGENAYRLVRPLFEWSLTRGRTQRVHHPLAHKGSSAKGRGLPGLSSALVGREDEMRALVGAVERVQVGVGGLVTLLGEAGVGKSRLVAEVRSASKSHSVQWVEGRCLSFENSTAYQLWLDLLNQVLGLKQDPEEEMVLDALRARVRALCPERYDAVYPYLARLYSLSVEPNDQGAISLEGESLRVQIFYAVETVIESAAKREPLVIVCDDLHWSDATSLALLERVLELVDRAPVLYICVYRPEPEHPSWQIRETAARRYRHRHTDLWLDALSAEESQTLVKSLLRLDRLPDVLRTRILDRAEGNPFYVEEIIRSLMESGALARDKGESWYAVPQVPEVTIPETLQGVLVARIDRLPPQAKGILQIASVIGHTFTCDLLSALEPSLSEGLDAQLILLQRAQLILERRRLPEIEFVFKHALIQEAAYHSLPNHERRGYHHRAAEALEQLFSGQIEGQLGLVAYHWERANVPGKAVPYLLRAGEYARLRYSNQQALAHLHRALNLLGDLEPSQERKRWQLRAHRCLGQAHWALGEVDDAEVHLREAISIGRDLGLPPRELVSLYHWLADTLFWKRQYEDMIAIGQEGLSLLGDDRTSTETALMNHMVGIAYAAQGYERRANTFFVRNARFLLDLPYTPDLRPAYTDLITMYRQDKQVDEAQRWSAALHKRASRVGDLRAVGENHIRAGIILANAGDWRGALARYQRGREVFDRIGDARHQGVNLANIGQAHLVLGELDAAQRYAQRAIRTVEPLQTRFHLASCQWLAGIVALCRHEPRDALDFLHKAADNAPDLVLKAPILHSLGRAYLALGQQEQARVHLDTALELTAALGPVLDLRAFPLNWFVHASLAALEGIYETSDEGAGAFRAFCQRFQESHPETLDWPLVEWSLAPTALTSHTAASSQDASAFLGGNGSWQDPFGDCSYAVRREEEDPAVQGQSVEIYAANGRDLWQINQSAPRLTWPVTGHLALQACCMPIVDPISRKGPPAVGGLLLWQNERNYLRLDCGLFGPRSITLLGCVEGQDVVKGRGTLGAESVAGEVYLRLARVEEQITALCSPDGRHWFTAGRARLPADGTLQVGLYAVGLLDRSIYQSAYPKGTAIRFESIQLWTDTSTTPLPAAAGQ